MKDAKGHGSDPRGAHSDGVNKIGQPSQFHRASPQEFLAARNQSSRAGYFTPHDDPNELNQHTLLLSADGKVGSAVSPTGDVQSVFNNSGIKGAGGAAIEAAKTYGGRTLDAFGEPLAKIYKEHGFVETGRAPFDPAQAPPKWDAKKDGTPDVIFMALPPRAERRRTARGDNS
jgi:hypothetical protein